MSDELHSKEETRPARDEKGRLLPGHTANPAGRNSLPDWFKAKGPDALKHLSDVADGTLEDVKISRAMACLSVIERVYGKAPQAPEDNDALERAWEHMLSRLRGGTEP